VTGLQKENRSKMREAWQWQEGDVEALIREQRKEDLRLEYKCSDSLAKTEPKKAELSKDVSAMANSAGGVIIYGIDELKKSSGPIQLDAGIDPKEISTEWLEQVIDSRIERRIDGISVNPVKMTGTGKFVYVVWVPQSNRAPHMASDHRYYKRLGTTTAVMEEYEVRDVSRRSESPDLYLELKVRGETTGVIVEPLIGNRSAEPVLYATCRLYIEEGLGVVMHPRMTWSKLDDTDLLFNNIKTRFHVIRYPWSVPERHPILEAEKYPMEVVHLNLGYDYQYTPEVRKYSLGWELRAPKTLPALRGLKLTIDHTGPRIEPFVYSLKQY
jgi:Putative DNA-binding domain